MTQAYLQKTKTPVMTAIAPAMLQRACACGGNPGPSGECESCRRKRLGLQTKLAVSQPGDRWEQEADRLADNVVSNSFPETGSRPAVMRKALAAPGLGQAPESVQATLHSGSQPLENGDRNWMETRFGFDFGAVRIHTDQRAADSARDVDALAYTVGRDIVFATGQYAPGSQQGRRLLAHELAHVVQQTAGSGEPPLIARQTPPQARPPGQVEAENRAQWYPSYPGCGPWQRRRLDYQLTLARSHVRSAVAALNDELSPSASGIITLAGSALQGQFHTHDPAHIRTIITRMEHIGNMLDRGVSNFRCVTQAGCVSECGGSGPTDACASPSAPIRLCPSHFENGNYQGTMNLIHEAGHQSGRGMAGGTSHIYRHDARFAGLTTAQAMNNPDSYALFVRDLHYGGPLARDLGPGAPPEAPHEREARAQREGRVWAPRDMGLMFALEEPSVQANMGWMDGRQQAVPAASRRVRDRFKGTINFFPDSVGLERQRPYPAPVVSARITLQRSTGRRSVLLDASDNNPADTGAGSSLRTSFNQDFDFPLNASDRGTIQVEMRMQDFDTATTITFRDFFTVQP